MARRIKVAVPTLPHETIEDRAALCNAKVSLDGRPARITGYMLEFANVSVRSNPDFRVEFAWATVARIVAKGGSFNS